MPDQKAKTHSCWTSFFDHLPTKRQIIGAAAISLGVFDFVFQLYNGSRPNTLLDSQLITLGITAMVCTEKELLEAQLKDLSKKNP